MKKLLTTALLALAALVLPLQAAAEDIDLFVGNNTSAGATPNILIILDNTANWNTAFANEKSALVTLFNSLPTNPDGSAKFNVGIMMFTETGGGNTNVDGGYVRAAIRAMNSSNKGAYASMINAFDVGADKSNGGKASLVMMEAYRYLSSPASGNSVRGIPYGGTGKKKADYNGNGSSSNGNAFDRAVWSLGGNALASFSATSYSNPIDALACPRTYIIYISNGSPAENSSDLAVARDALAAAGGNTTQIPLNPAGSQDSYVDEWARFLKTSSVGAAVYTLDIDKVTSGQGPGWSAALKSMSSQSGGKYFDISSNASTVLTTLQNIFSEIQSVNSVFASVSLPISVNTQGTFLNQVFIGMFRPENDSFPRWAGNLKQYKIGLTNGSLRLQDADSNAAINNITGFVTECARSFWTPTSVDTEWASSPKGDCLSVANSASSNYPDGNVVEKGGQAYKLRNTSSRTALTCNNSSCTSAVTFNTTNVTPSMLGTTSTTVATQLVNWALGTTVPSPDAALDSLNANGRRLSSHGDVVHSRPVAVNFGTDGSPSVMVFYGANDGWLRAVNGNRSADIGTSTAAVSAGTEAWAFMPNEFVPKIKRLYDNSPPVKYPGTLVGSATAKDYAMDGPITAFQGNVAGTTKTLLYATMRRGGRSIYAFDVTNSATAPRSPTFKWRAGCSASGECYPSELANIGQTWSSVKTFTHAQYVTGSKPLLIFGGGYDSCEDFDGGVAGTANHNCTAASKGHYVYILDGDTGAHVASFDTGEVHGIIADVLIVPDSSGHAQYAYVSDLGGNVYRITFNGAPASWTMTKIASLGCSSPLVSCTATRKFMFEPSVIQNSDGSFTLFIGSGDREKPVTSYPASNAVTNYFFSFTDKPTVAASTYPGNTDGCGSNIICLSSLLGITGNNPPSDAALAAKKGWYINLSPTEQVVTAPITIFGVVTFSTHQPAPATSTNTCNANLGTTRVYSVNYKNAGSENGTNNLYQDVAGDGLPPSAVAGQVTLDTGQTVPFCIGCSPDSPLEVVQKSGGTSSSRPKSRLYWYLKK